VGGVGAREGRKEGGVVWEAASVCVCVVRARDVLDVGFGVPGVVQCLFLGGCPRRSPRQERVVVDSVVEIARCQPSAIREQPIGAREVNVTFVSVTGPIIPWRNGL
jgi:hypothetical protein